MNSQATRNVNLKTFRVEAGTHYDTEPCKVCKKLIYFTSVMTRANYAYKREEGSKQVFCCGWSHFRQDEPKGKTKSKFKGGY